MSDRIKCPYCHEIAESCGCDPALVEAAENRKKASQDDGYRASVSKRFVLGLLGVPERPKRPVKPGLRGARRRLSFP